MSKTDKKIKGFRQFLEEDERKPNPKKKSLREDKGKTHQKLQHIFSPLAVIWSVNTLFGLTIAYGFWEWLAALVLLSCLSARNISSFKQK